MEYSDNGSAAGSKRTGAMLAAARVAAGLELADIARETRVPLRHLKALEADSHDELPALPYAIGFVKSFARAVGLDPEAVVSQFRAETSKSAHIPTSVSMEPLDERRLPSRLLVIASVVVVIGIIASLSAWGSGAFDAPGAVITAAPAAAPPVVVPTPSPAVAAVVDPAAVPVAGAPAGAPIVGGPVVLKAREDVWIKIYDKTTRTSVKTGTLAAGESFTVPADPPGLLLWTGKAGALDVTIAGRPIAPLGGMVETVRDVSLAPADLIARQAAKTAAAAPEGSAASAAPSSGLKPIATIPVARPPATAPVPAPGSQPAPPVPGN
ncbi:MAG: helix-turn-helix domain-containing protein [Sandarakinorhabdus sp.]|nr:helix-turn-helix domain-containing protein [Sandarakinorhabdus sp.]